MPQGRHLSSEEIVRLFTAVCMSMILFLQLFSFEKMPGIVEGAGIPGVAAYIVVILLVSSELLSLPVWMGMKVSKRTMLTSMVAAIVSLILLGVLETLAFLSKQTILFGATFDLPSGGWSLLFVAALWLLAGWGLVGQRSVLRLIK